jgi:hypothetical protein
LILFYFIFHRRAPTHTLILKIFDFIYFAEPEALTLSLHPESNQPYVVGFNGSSSAISSHYVGEKTTEDPSLKETMKSRYNATNLCLL